jgi:hypothetical protein
MSKVISYSLWGTNKKYTIGAIRNAELAAEIYPGWISYFQLDYSVPQDIEDKLASIDNVRVSRRLDHATRGIAIGDYRAMFWRFELACAQGVDVMISRDCDSRLSRREAAAVAEWLDSGEGFHIMRDHPWHGSKMLGGMWGCRGFALPEFNHLMNAWNKEDRWQTDQDFLNAEIYPRVVNNAMIHASFYRLEAFAQDFPVPRCGTEFVGQVFDENEVTVAEHIKALAREL